MIVPRSRRAFALVVVLSVLALMLGLIMAFFSRATSHRSVESVRAKRLETVQLERSAEHWVKASILREISTNSTLETTGEVTLFQPKSDAFRFPQRELPGGMLTDSRFDNLLRQSRSLAGVDAPHVTSDPSRNKRSLEASDWNAPRLLEQGGFDDATQLPRWFYLRPDGSVQATPASDATARFAFNLYDQSGLLDANVAGHPSGLTNAQSDQLRGTLAAADLRALGVDQTAIDSLIEFRHAGAGDFPARIALLGRWGFLRPRAEQSENRFFTSRQDLLRYVDISNPGLEPALPYLGHFSRETVAPLWQPTTPVGSTIDYATLSKNSTSANRALASVRATATRTITRYRDDGSIRTYQVNVGEPYVQTRFPLARLAWLGPNGRVGVSEQAVRDCFGLVWDDAFKRWNYQGNSILTLQQVESEGREPNFFELLKIGILSGSLGIDGGGGTGSGGSLIFPSTQEADADLQILKIGANLIDQADADSIPTAISILRSGTAWESVGVESLPGIAQFKAVAGKSPDNPNNRVAIYLLANLWNPHRSGPTGIVPNLRITVKGTLRVVTRNVAGTTIDHALPALSTPISASLLGPGILPASGLAPGTATGLAWTSTPSALGNYAGFRLPDYRPAASDSDPLYGGSSGNNVILRFSYDNNDPFQLMLEYEAAPGVWRGYSFLQGNNDPTTWRKNNFQQWIAGGYPATVPLRPPDFSPALLNIRPTDVRLDPRATRFTPIQFDASPAGMFAGSLWPSSQQKGFGTPHSAFQLTPTLLGSGTVFPALLARNNSPDTRYADRDGIGRLADSGLFTGGASEGNPFSVAEDRSLVLNRPFQSTAEMGFACRDLPFRTLDFFTRNSADSGLLELFCLRENEAPLRAGVVQLNTRHTEVLEALLRGASLVPGNSQTLSDGQAATLAQAIVTATSAQPAASVAALASLAEQTALTGSEFQRKPVRELLSRALADTTQTRTWNLLADIVVQTGKFPTTGGTEAADFQTEGSSRRWISLGVDRFTGRIVEEQGEKFSN